MFEIVVRSKWNRFSTKRQRNQTAIALVQIFNAEKSIEQANNPKVSGEMRAQTLLARWLNKVILVFVLFKARRKFHSETSLELIVE